MKILLTNILMTKRSGTEIVTMELAYELRRRGHEIAIYAHQCGKLADTLRSHGIAVVDKISHVPFVPDVIHGHHNITLAIALVHFPNVPSIFICHDFDAWHDRAFIHPSIKKYIAVDELCLQRLTIDGMPIKKLRIINNAVVTRKFIQKEKIKDTPEKALLLSKGSTHSSLVKEVCQELDIELDLIGPAFDQTIDNLHEILKDYDIVFATARMALEALACGCCVIVCDHRGFAGTVTTDNWVHWYAWNLGRGLLIEEISKEKLVHAIAEYSSIEITKLTERVRIDTDIKQAVDQYDLVYNEIVSDSQEQSESTAADVNFYQFSLSTFLEDFLPSYNPNTSWFSIATKMTGVEAKDLNLLNDINDKLNQLQSESRGLHLFHEISTHQVITKLDQIQSESKELYALRNINSNLQGIDTKLDRLQTVQFESESEKLQILQKIRTKLSRLQGESKKLYILRDINSKLNRLQENTESIQQDIGSVGIVTRFLKIPYSKIKKIFTFVLGSKTQ